MYRKVVAKLNDFRSRLIRVMSEKNIKAAELSRRTGISKPRLSQYINGVYVPKTDAMCLIAHALGVSESYLFGKSDDISAPAQDPTKYKKLPIIGEISCGYPVFANQEDDGFVIPDADTDADFCLVAKGDSMKDARIYNGDVVYIKKSDMVNNGEIAAVVINDEATLKRVYRLADGRIELRAANARYAPILIGGEGETRNVRILGKAVAFQGNII